jgi:iron complex transport system ATP-binding protein
VGVVPALEAHALGYAVGPAWLAQGIDLEIWPGELVAIVGPNGAGKSTLCGLLGGDLRPARGKVILAGRALREFRPIELARGRAVLPQQTQLQFPFPVREVVLMGRHPHLRRGRPPTPHDDEIASAAMRDTDVAHLAGRSFTTLSGGEQTRVNLARVLAQDTPVLLLDEPTAALDLRHQQHVMALCRARAGRGDAVVVVLHDLALAAAWADRVAMMRGGRIVSCGSPDDVLTPELVSSVFEQPVVVFPHPRHGRPVVLPDAGVTHLTSLEPTPRGAHP